ncbi:MAG: SDR family NAD(P)-dependent oxidoreductase [Pseudomonadales bacterium]
MLALKNRTVVITGGATGIGFALAKACGKEGANIVIGEPREGRLLEAVAELTKLGIQAKSCPCDVTQPEQMEAFADFAFAAFGAVGLVVNNAGVTQERSTVIDTPLDELHRVFDVNFFGVWHGCKIFGQRLIGQGQPAAIYNTGSENSYFVAVVQSAAYVATKHAVYGLTDSLREEMPDYIAVGMITPGFVGSELIPEGLRNLGMPPDEFAEIALKQIKAGEFYVVSHGYNQVHIDQRYREVSQAFSKYTPRQEGDEKYDVRVLLSRLRD